MALSEAALGDTSVFTRFQRPQVNAELRAAIVGGLLHTCAMVRLEVMRGAQSRSRWAIVRQNLAELPDLRVTDEVWGRAEEVQELLAEESHHTAVKPPDLVIAAIAELANMPVVHYDRDFDLIAAVTGQDTRWVVPRGSID
jgi:hypothetical protein